MRSSAAWYQIDAAVRAAFPQLTPGQQRGLSLWVCGAILAQSACQTAVTLALVAAQVGSTAAVRQRLREWLRDGADKAAPCQAAVDVPRCFAPLLGWVLRWWQGRELVLAVDVTSHGPHWVVLAVSVLYRGTAIPVAWCVRPAYARGAWLPEILTLLEWLAPVVPADWTVLVLADRGLWSPRLWRRLRRLGWQPLLRVTGRCTVTPTGGTRLPARWLVPGPGHAWVGRGVAFADPARQVAATILVVWEAGHTAPWILLTERAPDAQSVLWYGLRMWIECGFRVLKRLGWQWQRTQRREPTRVARHWLVLAVATLWTVAHGTRLDDAERLGVAPARLRTPPARLPDAAVAHGRPRRTVSVFRRGLLALSQQAARGRLWTRLWLRPDPLPTPPPTLTVHLHPAPP